MLNLNDKNINKKCSEAHQSHRSAENHTMKKIQTILPKI